MQSCDVKEILATFPTAYQSFEPSEGEGIQEPGEGDESVSALAA